VSESNSNDFVYMEGERRMAQSNVVGGDEVKEREGRESYVKDVLHSRGQSPKGNGNGVASGVTSPTEQGLSIDRHFTSEDRQVMDEVVWERRTSVITNPDGSVVFKMEGAEIPAEWSQLATDIVVSKYFRKAGLHGDKNQGERSVAQVVHRVAHTIRRAG
jgi:ribonucleoside-diphosphate reductase alpha chain